MISLWFVIWSSYSTMQNKYVLLNVDLETSSFFTPGEPRSVSPWTLTGCVQATSTPLPSTSLSQWHSSSSATWPKAQTGESQLEINERLVASKYDTVHPSVCQSVTPPSSGDGDDLVSCVSACRDLSVDAGLPHHQYQLQQLPQHYQHYLASPRMHHFPRNTSSAQVVCFISFLRFY